MDEAKNDKDDSKSGDGSPGSGYDDNQSHSSYLSGTASKKSSGVMAEGGESVQDEDQPE